MPVIELGHLSAAQRKAYVLADNRLAEQPGWDRELLALEVADLSEMGVDLASLGFEAAEIDQLLRSAAADPREEETPEPPALPVSRPGDLWLLGRTGKVLNDDRADWREAWALFPGEVAYVWHGALHATTVAESLLACGFGIRSQIIWAKERLVLSRDDCHWQHEPCWYAVR